MSSNDKNITMNNDAPKSRNSRAEQSRINGAKSRGPKTEEGKRRSSRNAFKHGLTSNYVLSEENPRELDLLTDLWASELLPESPAQRRIVRKIALAEFCLDRAVALNTNLLDYETDTRSEDYFKKWPSLTRTGAISLALRDANIEHRAFELLRRYETECDRSSVRNLRLLCDLQERNRKRAQRRKLLSSAANPQKNQPVTDTEKEK